LGGYLEEGENRFSEAGSGQFSSSESALLRTNQGIIRTPTLNTQAIPMGILMMRIGPGENQSGYHPDSTLIQLGPGKKGTPGTVLRPRNNSLKNCPNYLD